MRRGDRGVARSGWVGLVIWGGWLGWGLTSRVARDMVLAVVWLGQVCSVDDCMVVL